MCARTPGPACMTSACVIGASAFFLNFTVTVPVVVLPAFGLEETNLPLPRILYLQPALLSFFRAFLTVRPLSFGTLHFFFLAVAGGVVAAASDDGGAGIRPILLPANSVNHSAPSGPDGDRARLTARGRHGELVVSVLEVLMRPILFGVVSVYQIAPSEPVAIPEALPPLQRTPVICPVVLDAADLVPANSVNHSAPPVAVMPDGSLPAVGIGESMSSRSWSTLRDCVAGPGEPKLEVGPGVMSPGLVADREESPTPPRVFELADPVRARTC